MLVLGYIEQYHAGHSLISLNLNLLLFLYALFLEAPRDTWMLTSN